MINVGKIENFVGPRSLNHTQRITTKISKLNYIRIGEDIIDGKTRFKEVITQGWNYFRRAIMSYDVNGKRIENSKFVEVIKGEVARKKKIPHFGVII